MAYAVGTVTSYRFADTSQMDNYFQWFGIIQLPSSVTHTAIEPIRNLHAEL